MIKTVLRIFLASMLGFAAAGCTTQPVRQQPVESVREDLQLHFIESGSTTRAQVLEELGEPFLRFDDEQIYTYYLTRDRKASRGDQTTWSAEVAALGGALGRTECMRVQPHICASEHQLILVFDDQGVLTGYSYLRAAAER